MLKAKSQLLILTLSLLASLALASSAVAATQWVTNPASCNHTDPPNFPGQNCIAPVNICGDLGGIAQCHDTSTLSAPGVSASSSIYNGGLTAGGYVVNCYVAADGGDPYCDNSGNFWCNSDSSCYVQNRNTTCTALKFAYQGGAFTCGTCMTNYADCDAGGDTCEIHFGVTPYANPHTTYATCLTPQCAGGYTDCNGGGSGADPDGCEVQNGGACTLGGLPGTYVGCTCIVPKSNFQTGTLSSYATVDPLLWGRQYGAGDLISFGNASATDVFSVANDGVVKIAQASIPGVTANKLYNVGGSLYWDGTLIGTASGGVTWPLLAPDGSVAAPSYSFTNSTGMGMYRAGANILSLVTAGTDRLTIDASGNVGIGTTTPAYKLSLAGTVMPSYPISNSTPSIYVRNEDIGNAQGHSAIKLAARGASSVGDSILDLSVTQIDDTTIDSRLWVTHPSDNIGGMFGNYGLAIGTGLNSGAVAFFTNNNQQMIINQSGAVGIGTATPQALLDIFVDSPGGDMLRISGNDIGSGEGIGLYGGVTRYAGWDTNDTQTTFGTGANIPLLLTTNNIERMRITGTGIVGIGTSTPGSNGEILTVEPDTSSGPGSGSWFHAIDILDPDMSVVDTKMMISLGRGIDDFANDAQIYFEYKGSGDPANRLGFGLAYQDDIMSLTGDGFVGMGNTDPTSLLDVAGAFTQRNMSAPALSPAGQGRIYFDDVSNTFKVSQNNGAYVDLVGGAGGANGWVDLGATVALLTASDDVSLDAGQSYGATPTRLYIANPDNNNPLITLNGGDNSDSSARILFVANTENKGSVGWDTNYSAITLASESNFPIKLTTTGGNNLFITNTGRVGIGTATPGAILDVNGQALIQTLTVGLGGGAIASNMAFGTNALLSNTTGIHNTAIGSNALYSNDSGNYNVALGEEALYTNTWGGDNVAIGDKALQLNDANYNIAIGPLALGANTSGEGNTAIGVSALRYNDGGAYNMAFGMDAMRYSDGSSNTAIGNRAMRMNESGNENTAIGYEALYSNTTGSTNIAIGNDALYDLNILNGTGNNTAIGYYTGGGIVTGVNNTIIGSNVTGLAAGLSNNIIIADGSGNRRINVDSNGYVGIGTVTPNNAIQVAGLIDFGPSSNTFLGANAGGSTPDDGNLNTAVGDGALASITDGGQNTAVGAGALSSNTDGNYNLAIGSNALAANTSGTANLAFGSEALINNDIGQENTAIGVGSMYSNTDGNKNLALGTTVLRLNTSGSNNIGLGWSTLFNNSTGNNNIAIGYQAGDDLTTGSNNIIIGYNIDAPSATGNNQLNIGNAIYGDLSTGNIGIGTTTPTAPLEIVSDSGYALKFSRPSSYPGVYGALSMGAIGDEFGLVNQNDAYIAVSYGNDYIYGSNLVTGDRIITANGNTGYVGIGTASPANKLSIDGNISAGGAPSLYIHNYYPTDGMGGTAIRLDAEGAGPNHGYLDLRTDTADDGTGGGSVIYSGTVNDSGLVIGTGVNNGPLSFNTNGAQRMVVNANGAVAIGQNDARATYLLNVLGGATDANLKLDSVDGSGNGNSAFITINSDTAGGGNAPYIGLLNNGINAGYIWGNATDMTIMAASGSSVIFDTNGEKMRIAANGNVGIGITAPTANLQVAQSTLGIGTVSISGTAVTGVGTQFTNTFKVGDTITATTTSGSETKAITAVTSNTVLATAAFTGTASGVAYTLAGGTRFAALGNGNVGIGTASPANKLSIDGNIAQGGAPSLLIHNYDGGMGTGASAIRLDAQGASNRAYLDFRADTSDDGTGGAIISYSGNVDEAGLYIGTGTTSGPLTFFTAGIPAMWIASSNQFVGIGTSNPGYPLEVNGAVAFRWDGDPATASMKIDDGNDYVLFGGQIGIGTTTPAGSAALDITSTTNGFLPPRMTTAQRNLIGAPAAGLTVYNTNTGALEVYNGAGWGTTLNLWTDNGVTLYTNNIALDVAFGGSTTAAPFYFDASLGSLKVGATATVTGTDSIAVGASAHATNNTSVALGWATASGTDSVAMGANVVSSGFTSVAAGGGTRSSGQGSVALGWDANASGTGAVAAGWVAYANGNGSFATGNATVANGVNSAALGFTTTSQAYDSFVMGRYNVISGTTGSWVNTDPLFIIGNGASGVLPSNAVTVLKNGNFGIGLTAPTANLQVAQSTLGIGTVSISGTAVTGVGTQFTNTFKVGDTITATTTSGSETQAITTVTSDTVLVTAAFAGTASGVPYTLAGGTRLAVLGNGLVGIGTAAPTHLLDMGIGGGYYNEGTGAWINGSDRNYKDNILDMTKYGLDTITALRPVSYTVKQSGIEQIGFIAQEVKDVIPELVSGTDGSMGLNYGGFAPVLVKAMQEQQDQIDQINALIGSLKMQSGVSAETLDNLVLTGGLSIASEVDLGRDSAGEAVVKAGATEVAVTFENPYQYQPVVTISKASPGALADYYVDEITKTGFKIKIDPVYGEDIKFGWHAFGSKDGKRFFSNGLIENLETNPMPTEPAPATEPIIEPATEPAPAPATEPVIEPVIEPATEPVPAPATEPVIEPATEPAPAP